MGYCFTIPDEEIIGIECRSESIRISRRYIKDEYGDAIRPADPVMFAPGPVNSVEIDKAFLSCVLAFFDNPENRRLCDLDVPEPLPTAL